MFRCHMIQNFEDMHAKRSSQWCKETKLPSKFRKNETNILFVSILTHMANCLQCFDNVTNSYFIWFQFRFVKSYQNTAPQGYLQPKENIETRNNAEMPNNFLHIKCTSLYQYYSNLACFYCWWSATKLLSMLWNRAVKL